MDLDIWWGNTGRDRLRSGRPLFTCVGDGESVPAAPWARSRTVGVLVLAADAVVVPVQLRGVSGVSAANRRRAGRAHRVTVLVGHLGGGLGQPCRGGGLRRRG